jgi:hypothetical protein
MTVRIRFHLDENVDSAVADGLRRRGVDVTMPNDVGLIGASDEAHRHLRSPNSESFLHMTMIFCPLPLAAANIGGSPFAMRKHARLDRFWPACS